MFARSILIAAAFATTLTSFAPVTAFERKGNVSIKFSGQLDWHAECRFTRQGGKETELRKRGRGSMSSASINQRNITGGSCTLTVPEGTMLKVDFLGTGLIMCPFESNDPCIDYFKPGDPLEFSF